MRRRGVTLLELLIVIALLAGAAALVLPAMGGLLSEWSFASTVEGIEAQLLLARAEAMASGRPMEVRWLAETSEISVVEFDAAREAVDGEQTERVDLLSGIEPGDPAWSDAMLENLIPVTEIATTAPPPPVESLFIPREHRLSDKAEEIPAATGLPALEDFALETTAEDEAPRSFCLAVYLADGSALLSRRLMLIDELDEARLASLEINPWTGLPRFERIEVTAESTETVANAPPETEFRLDDQDEGDAE